VTSSDTWFAANITSFGSNNFNFNGNPSSFQTTITSTSSSICVLSGTNFANSVNCKYSGQHVPSKFNSGQISGQMCGSVYKCKTNTAQVQKEKERDIQERIPIFDRFSSIQLVNNFQSGTVDGICPTSVRQNCVNQCNAGCSDIGECIFGCEIGGINKPDQCAHSCSTLGQLCLDSCVQTGDCITRECSTFVKFDIILQNYKWISNDKASKLVFKYGVKGKNTAVPTVSGDTLTFGDFWVQFNTSSYSLPKQCIACDNKTCICDSKSSLGSSVNAYISKQGYANVEFRYNKFDSHKSLVNDPAIGISHPLFVADNLDTLNSSSSVFAFSFALLSLLFAALFF